MTTHLTPTSTPPPTAPPAPQPASAEDNPFPYGWRYVRQTLPDGTTDLVQVPLTLEDALHPEEDDVIPEIDPHEQERGDLKRIFSLRLPREKGGLVLSDCLVDWGIPGIRNHSPDVSVFAGLTAPFEPWVGTFRLRPSGGRCVLAIELVSPNRRVNDVVHKFREYHEAGVPLYVIVDQEREAGPRQLRGYRRTPRGYEPIPLEESGRLLLEPLRLYLGLRENRVVCFDADTGEEIGDYAAVTYARQDAERRAREEAEARALAEQRVRDLEAELRRVAGRPPDAGPG